jgi:hypothetical protein
VNSFQDLSGVPSGRAAGGIGNGWLLSIQEGERIYPAVYYGSIYLCCLQAGNWQMPSETGVAFLIPLPSVHSDLLTKLEVDLWRNLAWQGDIVETASVELLRT